MVTLANDEIAVTADVAFGARITSLLDRSTGREWLVTGAAAGSSGETAVYGAAEAIGWDECFPTVAPWDASSTPWGRPLRDHGDLWGRPAELLEHSDSRLVTLYSGTLFALRRTIELDSKSLRASYRLENRAAQPLPYLWALHGLLSVTPADRIVLPGIDKVLATHLSRGGEIVTAHSLPWPGPDAHWPEPLDMVQPAPSQLAAKLYVENWPGGVAFVGNDAGWLRVSWGDEIDSLGIWLNYGGWPSPGSVHHIAFEPTNAPVDHLGQAIARGTPAVPPGESRTWKVEFTVRAPAP